MNPLQKFEKIKRLGSGGQGEVFLVKDLIHNKKYALKLYNKDITHPEIEREIELLTKIRHKNIISLENYGVLSNGQIYTLNQYFSQGSLVDLEKKRDIKVKDKLTIYRDVGKAILYLHENKIIHRDIKPGNIFVKKIHNSYKGYLGDFGLAKQTEDSMLTRSLHGALGSELYLPPEILLNEEKMSYKSDIYSLGISIYYSITGKLPYGDTAQDLIKYLQNPQKAPELSNFLEYVPDELENLLSSMIHHDKKQRLYDLNVYLERLEDILNNKKIISLQAIEDYKNQPLFSKKKLYLPFILFPLAIVGYMGYNHFENIQEAEKRKIMNDTKLQSQQQLQREKEEMLKREEEAARKKRLELEKLNLEKEIKNSIQSTHLIAQEIREGNFKKIKPISRILYEYKQNKTQPLSSLLESIVENDNYFIYNYLDSFTIEKNTADIYERVQSELYNNNKFDYFDNLLTDYAIIHSLSKVDTIQQYPNLFFNTYTIPFSKRKLLLESINYEQSQYVIQIMNSLQENANTIQARFTNKYPLKLLNLLKDLEKKVNAKEMTDIKYYTEGTVYYEIADNIDKIYLLANSSNPLGLMFSTKFFKEMNKGITLLELIERNMENHDAIKKNILESNDKLLYENFCNAEESITKLNNFITSKQTCTSDDFEKVMNLMNIYQKYRPKLISLRQLKEKGCYNLAYHLLQLSQKLNKLSYSKFSNITYTHSPLVHIGKIKSMMKIYNHATEKEKTEIKNEYIQLLEKSLNRYSFMFDVVHTTADFLLKNDISQDKNVNKLYQLMKSQFIEISNKSIKFKELLETDMPYAFEFKNNLLLDEEIVDIDLYLTYLIQLQSHYALIDDFKQCVKTYAPLGFQRNYNQLNLIKNVTNARLLFNMCQFSKKHNLIEELIIELNKHNMLMQYHEKMLTTAFGDNVRGKKQGSTIGHIKASEIAISESYFNIIDTYKISSKKKYDFIQYYLNDLTSTYNRKSINKISLEQAFYHLIDIYCKEKKYDIAFTMYKTVFDQLTINSGFGHSIASTINYINYNDYLFDMLQSLYHSLPHNNDPEILDLLDKGISSCALVYKMESLLREKDKLQDVDKLKSSFSKKYGTTEK